MSEANASRAKKMRGNTNAAKAEHVPARTVLSLSLTTSRKERLRAALEWLEGHVPDDVEVEAKARELAYLAWDQYVHAIEREQEINIL